MSWATLFIVMIICTFVLLMSGCWIAAGMGIVGVIGLIISGNTKLLQVLGNLSWTTANSFTMTAVPLFILMGEIILHGGLSKNFYLGVAKLTRRIPGGLLLANIVSSAIFSAISGSSVATAAAIGSAAIPEQKKLCYRDRYICGSLAAGGTLGILIPPSIALIIYGSLTTTSVVKLFIAAMVPGLLLAGLYLVFIVLCALVQKKYFDKVDMDKMTDISVKEALIGILPMIIYIMLGAQIVAYVWTTTSASRNMVSWIIGLNLSKWTFFLIVCIIYLILGCFVESNSMQYLTIPVLFPVIMEYGFDAIWFGVVLVILLELGQITPPMGINLFVIKGIDKETPLIEIIYGVIPYMLIMMLMIVILCVFPGIATFMV